MNTGETNNVGGQVSEELPINPKILADIDALLDETKTEKTTEQVKQEFADSPIGRWQAIITDCAPAVTLIHKDLELLVYKDDDGNTVNETEKLANALAPALAKHFPNIEDFSIPVELIAVFALHQIFTPKFKNIKAKKMKVVQEDESENA